MYMDMSIVDRLSENYGRLASLSAGTFFEAWRHYGFEQAIVGIPQRTYYVYLEMLVSVGLVIKVRQGLYQIASGYETPVV